ncbi:hypothetical protein FHT12_002413 [Xanthomonas campestris]|uniref:hypothetical protein n=1 Tax=Xanthomonas euroxanthea TaxID=2259622 RepID=UPI0011AFDA70|nr:hypothetical protein [Xanthomonas euroxanthea]NIJ93716.1 hypothetical protein [Xanthomonas euroxanthea]
MSVFKGRTSLPAMLIGIAANTRRGSTQRLIVAPAISPTSARADTANAPTAIQRVVGLRSTDRPRQEPAAKRRPRKVPRSSTTARHAQI